MADSDGDQSIEDKPYRPEDLWGVGELLKLGNEDLHPAVRPLIMSKWDGGLDYIEPSSFRGEPNDTQPQKEFKIRLDDHDIWDKQNVPAELSLVYGDSRLSGGEFIGSDEKIATINVKTGAISFEPGFSMDSFDTPEREIIEAAQKLVQGDVKREPGVANADVEDNEEKKIWKVDELLQCSDDDVHPGVKSFMESVLKGETRAIAEDIHDFDDAAVYCHCYATDPETSSEAIIPETIELTIERNRRNEDVPFETQYVTLNLRDGSHAQMPDSLEGFFTHGLSQSESVVAGTREVVDGLESGSFPEQPEDDNPILTLANHPDTSDNAKKLVMAFYHNKDSEGRRQFEVASQATGLTGEVRRVQISQHRYGWMGDRTKVVGEIDLSRGEFIPNGKITSQVLEVLNEVELEPPVPSEITPEPESQPQQKSWLIDDVLNGHYIDGGMKDLLSITHNKILIADSIPSLTPRMSVEVEDTPEDAIMPRFANVLLDTGSDEKEFLCRIDFDKNKIVQMNDESPWHRVYLKHVHTQSNLLLSGVVSRGAKGLSGDEPAFSFNDVNLLSIARNEGNHEDAESLLMAFYAAASHNKKDKPRFRVDSTIRYEDGERFVDVKHIRRIRGGMDSVGKINLDTGEFIEIGKGNNEHVQQTMHELHISDWAHDKPEKQSLWRRLRGGTSPEEDTTAPSGSSREEAASSSSEVRSENGNNGLVTTAALAGAAIGGVMTASASGGAHAPARNEAEANQQKREDSQRSFWKVTGVALLGVCGALAADAIFNKGGYRKSFVDSIRSGTDSLRGR